MKMSLKTNKEPEIKLQDYLVRGTSLYYLDETKDGTKEIFVANAAKVKRVIRTLETGDIVLEIEYYSFDRWETLRIARGKLVRTELPYLMDKGMDVAGGKYKSVFQFLDFHEKKCEISYIHQQLGWEKFNGQLTFRLSEAIQLRNTFSDYEGPFSIKPKGRLQVWLDLILQEVIGQTPLEAILGASFAAPVAALLNVEKIADVDSLLFNIVGNSTTGKTTAATIAASPFGNPSITQNGLIQSFNGTTNALQACITGNFGVPIIFDETSMNTMSSTALTSFIYKLAQNKEKARLDKESVLKENQFWCTSIFFTGETSIISQAKNNEGLRVRLFEFKNIQWTKDGEHAERIKQVLMNNYGHAGEKYIQHLLSCGIEVITAKWQEYKLWMLEKMPDTKFKTRITSKFATILTGAYFANEALGITLSIDAIGEFLVQQELESMDERELAPKFYEQFKQKIIQYRKHFRLNNEVVENHQEIWGKIETKNDKTYCYVLTLKFKELVESMGFVDANILMDELKSSGKLHHDSNKLQTKKVVFKKEESAIREEVLGDKKYSSKGDYTVCIVYEGDILEGFYEDEATRDANLKNFDPTMRSPKVARQRPTINHVKANDTAENLLDMD